MRSPKLSVNTFLLILLIFGGFTFFITVLIVRMADRTPVNSFHPFAIPRSSRTGSIRAAKMSIPSSSRAASASTGAPRSRESGCI